MEFECSKGKYTTMKKSLILTFSAAFLLSACKKNETRSATLELDTLSSASIDSNVTEDTPALGATTENALDWFGRYEGTLPCASCPGIETEIELTKEYTYALKQTYLEQEKGEKNEFTEKGKIVFSKDGSYITLEPDEVSNLPTKSVFFIGEGYMYQVSAVGDREFKEIYKLNKTL